MICESILIEIQLKKETLLVLGVYRPPSADLDKGIDILTALLDKSLERNKKILLMGDINVNNLHESNDNTKLEELLECYNISRLKLPPTRITSQTSTSIDWVCTNINQDNIQTSVIQSGLSDHTAQAVSLNLSHQTPPTAKHKRRNFSKTAVQLLKTNLGNQNWCKVYHSQNADTAYNIFHTTIQSHLNLACPYVTSRHNNKRKKQYWDEECTRLKGAYIEALEQELRSGKEEDKKETVSKKKEYDLKLKNLRKEQVTAHIANADNKSKASWQVIKEERTATTKTNTKITLQDNGKLVEDPVEVANYFNNFFASIAEKTLQNNIIIQNQIDLVAPPINLNQFKFQIVTQKEVHKAIDTLKPKTSCGIDDVSAKLLKTCKEELLPPLTNLVNKSLEQGIFPSELKIAKIYPKFKKGNPNEPNSYRPISLISTFSKVIEKIVLKQLLDYLKKNDLLTSQQHGFLKGRSTATALIQLVEHIIDQLEEGNTVTSLFLDFSKAFDCLDHTDLLGKMRALGIAGTAGNWFQSYLSNRKQLVELQFLADQNVEKAKSGIVSMERGVPQGSVLGPMLFLLLTNDLPRYLANECQTVMFADDTVITLAGKEKEQLLSNIHTSFNKTKDYCSTNNLVLNEQKTVQVVFNTKNKHMDVSLPGLHCQPQTKHLGVLIDSSLNWRPHLDQLCKKLSSGIFAIRRLKQISNFEVAKLAYFAFVESHLRYGIATWGGAASSALERVLIQQRRAVRCLVGLEHGDNCRKAFTELKILTVISIYIQEVILHTVTATKTRNQDLHDYNTRNASNFALPVHHLSLFSKKPSYSGAKLYNLLPEEIKNGDPQHFKKRLTSWLQERPFYSLQEYLKREQ